jgi:hypothetical protein
MNIRMGSVVGLAMALAVSVGCVGCASQETWVYRSNSYAQTGGSGKKVAVLPFADSRPQQNHDITPLCMVPFVPYGSQHLDLPENLSMHTASGAWVGYKPTDDFPKALAEDLRKSHLFADAFFNPRRDTADYVVAGRIISTRYTGRTITYGVSICSPFLWLMGLPAGWTENELTVELALIDGRNGKTLFTKTYTAVPRERYFRLYRAKSDLSYAEMLAELNRQFCADIQPVLLAATPAP